MMDTPEDYQTRCHARDHEMNTSLTSTAENEPVPAVSSDVSATNSNKQQETVTEPGFPTDLGECTEDSSPNKRRRGLYGAQAFGLQAQPGEQSEMALMAAGKAGTDLDRDEQGNLYTRQIPVLWSRPHLWGATLCSQPHQAHSQRPDNNTKKRKHSHLNEDMLPSPSFLWQGTTDPHFTAFNGILMFPELCFLLAAQLPLRDLISLYSISRDFHRIIDTRFTTTCLTIANYKAPQSAKIFHFRMYSQYCRPDPANRIPHPNPIKAANRQPRLIPSFRWVAFVLFREKVVHELMAIFAENGVPLPPQCEIALKRMWLIMDIPDNARRIGLIHNRTIIPDLDLYFMFCFFVRLDMLCHDPLAQEKHDGLRKLMLSQPDGLLTVLLVLKRTKWTHSADLLLAWVKHACEVPAVHEDNFDPVAFGAQTIFGIPVEQAGLGKYEYWGQRGAIKRTVDGQKQRYAMLMRPDQLVMREAVRRGLRFSKVALKSILTGYIDDETLESNIARSWPRRIPEWNGEEYAMNDVVGGVQALDPNFGGDELLDLGPSASLHSSLIVKSDLSESASDIAQRMRDEEDIFLDLCVHFCGAEFAKIDIDDPISKDEMCLLP